MKVIPKLKRTATVVLGTAATALIASVIYAAVPATQRAGADPLPPMATSPQPSRKANLVPVPYRPVMPDAVVSHDPRMVAADKSHALRPGPAVDLPPLADSVSPVPADPVLPAGPPIHVASADISILPIGTIAGKPDTGRPTAMTDPTASLAQPGALIKSPPPRTASPAAQLLVIPDPAHQQGFIPTPVAAAEDAPAASIDRPGPTTLPVTGK